MSKTRWILKGAAAVLFFLLVAGTATLLLWNWLMPDLFGVPQIDFWQALGLLVLSKILFGWKGGPGKPSWKEHWRSRLAAMTPEEDRKSTRLNSSHVKIS